MPVLLLPDDDAALPSVLAHPNLPDCARAVPTSTDQDRIAYAYTFLQSGETNQEPTRFRCRRHSRQQLKPIQHTALEQQLYFTIFGRFTEAQTRQEPLHEIFACFGFPWKNKVHHLSRTELS